MDSVCGPETAVLRWKRNAAANSEAFVASAGQTRKGLLKEPGSGFLLWVFGLKFWI